MVLIIDNYDSFTWNLAQSFMMLGSEVRVLRNDAPELDDIDTIEFDFLVISPGPGRPEKAGYSIKLIRQCAGKKPILGVCLGHQAIGAAFGASIVGAKKIMHGKADSISHDGRSLFADMANPLRVIRYHSLAVDEKTLPAGFEIAATSSDGEIMAMRNPLLRIEGLQFHPESIGTEDGQKLLKNFLESTKSNPPVKSLLRALSSGAALTRGEAFHLMNQIAQGELKGSQVGAALCALSTRGPTVDEVSGFVSALLGHATPFPANPAINTIDTCGTGGDSSGSFNISTAAALVAAASGARVAKFGNRSITSRCGSADVIEALGIPINQAPALAADALCTKRFAFLFASDYHPAFRHIGPIRRELGFRTVFNMIGPLLNPAMPQGKVLGVFDPDLTELLAQVLCNLGVVRALVVHGEDGMDEISLSGTTKVTELKNGWFRSYVMHPDDFGLRPCTLGDLKGGSASDNARDIEGICSLSEQGPKRDAVLFNAAAAIYVAGIADSIAQGLEIARGALDTGKAQALLKSLTTVGAQSAG